jgi:hypothetical protein
MNNEVWKEVYGISEYAVSNYGRIKRVKKGQGARCREIKWQTNTSNGYPVVRFCINGKQFAKSVHQIVALTFLGEKPLDKEIRHIDGNKLNNHLDNLAYGTKKENAKDKKLHGTYLFGENIHNAKLKNNDVINMRKMREEGFLLKDISSKFGIAVSTAGRVCRGITWRIETANARVLDRSAA